jgi:hypothetical protein
MSNLGIENTKIRAIIKVDFAHSRAQQTTSATFLPRERWWWCIKYQYVDNCHLAVDTCQLYGTTKLVVVN